MKPRVVVAEAEVMPVSPRENVVLSEEEYRKLELAKKLVRLKKLAMLEDKVSMESLQSQGVTLSNRRRDG